MKKILVAISAVVAVAGCSSVPLQRTAEFEQADKNSDGKVVLTEWLRFGGVESSFIAADTERRGSLEEAQFRQVLRFDDEATGKGAARNQKVYDNQISADVMRSLEQSRDVNAWNIKIEVYQGDVTLSGPVRTSREKQVAEQLAAGVVGVKTVFNQLAIRQ